MSAKMSKETFQRFTLLYLIGQFPDGIYSSFRLQKVLYYATRDVDPKPFTFKHTQYGQYSWEAAASLEELLESDLVQRGDLTREYKGNHWLWNEILDRGCFARAYEKAFPQHAVAVKKSVQKYRLMKQPELDERVHADSILREVPRGEVLHEETACEAIESPLSEDLSEDIELALAPRLLSTLARFAKVVAETDFDDSKVRTIDSLV